MKMSVLPKLISPNRFSAISIKVPARIFAETDKLILKFIWKSARPRIVKTILKKNNKVGGITLLDIKA